MAVRLFAAIDVGSYELCMKIVEFNNSSMRVVDNIKYRIDLGSYTYTTGRIPADKLEELCRILIRFTEIMKSYKIRSYTAYGTSAIRETENREFILDQIEQRTGIKISILSNSEQRFLDYKSIASKGEAFASAIEKGTAILDIGGGSLQLSLFDNDKLYVTQNIRLGVLRLNEELTQMSVKISRRETLLNELITPQLAVFEKLYLKKGNIHSLIVIDDYVSTIIAARTVTEPSPGVISREQYDDFFRHIRAIDPREFTTRYNVPAENIMPVLISAVMIKNVMNITGASFLWCPGVSIVDGIAYEFGEKKRLIAAVHNFEEDIVACAHNMAKRYLCDEKRGAILESICLAIFDSMYRASGMTRRDRLLIRLAAVLHDCGRYISIYNMQECSVDIIMATEIIGLSHEERAIVANVVKYNNIPFDYSLIRTGDKDLGRESYIRVAKLSAILGIANCLEFGQKHKFQKVSAACSADELIITVKTSHDMSLEIEQLNKKRGFFEEIFSVKPIIHRITKV